MKVKIPKAFKRLPPDEKEKLVQFSKDVAEDAAKELLTDALAKEEVEIQKIWLKMACICLHKNFGHDEEQCLIFLHGWKRLYHRNAKLTCKEEQTEWLNKELSAIFGDKGYPDEWVETLNQEKYDAND